MSLRTPTARNKIISGIILVAVFAAVFVLISPYISLEYLESQRSEYLQYYHNNPAKVLLLATAIAALCIGAALPTTGVFSLIGGALFGFPIGLFAMSIASTIGATIVFLWSRYLFRDWLQGRFHKQFSVVNAGIAEEGGYYLFSIRLMMVIPFFLVNLLCGLTNIKISTYVTATFFSQTIVVAVWVYAGATLASFESVADILNFETILALALVGLSPLIFHRIVLWVRGRRALSR